MSCILWGERVVVIQEVCCTTTGDVVVSSGCGESVRDGLEAVDGGENLDRVNLCY